MYVVYLCIFLFDTRFGIDILSHFSCTCAPASAESGWKGWSFHCLGENRKRQAALVIPCWKLPWNQRISSVWNGWDRLGDVRNMMFSLEMEIVQVRFERLYNIYIYILYIDVSFQGYRVEQGGLRIEHKTLGICMNLSSLHFGKPSDCFARNCRKYAMSWLWVSTIWEIFSDGWTSRTAWEVRTLKSGFQIHETDSRPVDKVSF